MIYNLKVFDDNNSSNMMQLIAKVCAQLLSPESSASLRLKEQPFVILIPKSLLTKFGLVEDEIIFDVVIENNKLSLVGPQIPNPRVKQSSAKEIVI